MDFGLLITCASELEAFGFWVPLGRPTFGFCATVGRPTFGFLVTVGWPTFGFGVPLGRPLLGASFRWSSFCCNGSMIMTAAGLCRFCGNGTTLLADLRRFVLPAPCDFRWTPISSEQELTSSDRGFGLQMKQCHFSSSSAM